MYREAQLYVGPKTCILPEGVKVSVLDQERIRVDVELTGPGAKESDDQLEVEILFEGRKIATAQGLSLIHIFPDAGSQGSLCSDGTGDGCGGAAAGRFYEL